MKGLSAFFITLLLYGELVHGQGTVYISNLQESTFTAEHVASDSWAAIGFETGTNPNGYALVFEHFNFRDGPRWPRGAGW